MHKHKCEYFIVKAFRSETYFRYRGICEICGKTYYGETKEEVKNSFNKDEEINRVNV